MRFLQVLLLSVFAAYAADSDALAIDAVLQSRHVPFGSVLNPIFVPGTTQIAGYTRCGDSALWTGHYLAAEAFRYRVTHAADALANLRGALNALTLLTDVTGRDLLARCAVPASSPYAAGIRSEEAANGVYSATLNGQSWLWIGNTSRDQYSGVFFGLGTAYDLVADASLRASMAALATRLLNHLLQSGWSVVMPDGSVSTSFILRPDQELALLQIGQHLNASAFAQEYARSASGQALASALPLSIDAADDHNSYFKFNLAFVNLYNLIRLETNDAYRQDYERGFAAVRSTTDNHLNPHFNMIDRALHGPDTARDAETRADLAAWLKRPRTDVFVDLRASIAACGAGLACHPIPVEQRPPSDFLWQLNPFQLVGGGQGIIETAGIDYLLPYWMARYYRVVRERPALKRVLK